MESYRTVDYHTGGEPFRIVPVGTITLPGESVADKRARALAGEEVHALRRFLCHEPRGHADMYGGLLTDPDDDGADIGVLFWHKDGFSTACGHGTIALGAWAVDAGLVPRLPSGTADFVVDVPSGRVTARILFEDHAIASIRFVNVASWVHSRQVPVDTRRGPATVDIAFGGAMYAILPAAALGLTVEPGHLTDLIAAGREIRDQLNRAGAAEHPVDERLSGVYGTIFWDEGTNPRPVDGLTAEGHLHQRNVTIFADGEVDRSPCGSGTAARVALLTATGQLPAGEVLVHDSIVGSRFRARVVDTASVPGPVAPVPAVIPEVEGMAYRVGESRFVLDPRDDLKTGFVLR